MSRSRRTYPATGITSAESEKRDKQRYNRRFRRAVREVLDTTPDADVLPHLYEYSDPWSMDKDGKCRFDPARFPKGLRK
jgi:hypothetical protein